VRLVSRKGKPFPHLEHLFDDLLLASQQRDDCSGIIFDGELYSDEMTFQRVVGLVKKETLSEEDESDMEKILFHVYDCILPEKPEMTNVHRYDIVEDIIAIGEPYEYLRPVKTECVNDEQEALKKHDKYVSEDYEGLSLSGD